MKYKMFQEVTFILTNKMQIYIKIRIDTPIKLKYADNTENNVCENETCCAI